MTWDSPTASSDGGIRGKPTSIWHHLQHLWESSSICEFKVWAHLVFLFLAFNEKLSRSSLVIWSGQCCWPVAHRILISVPFNLQSYKGTENVKDWKEVVEKKRSHLNVGVRWHAITFTATSPLSICRRSMSTSEWHFPVCVYHWFCLPVTDTE